MMEKGGDENVRNTNELLQLAGPRKPPKRASRASTPLLWNRPLRRELEEFWSAALPLTASPAHPELVDAGAAFLLARRGWCPRALAALDIIRITPHAGTRAWPKWWPKAWATAWRLVARAFNVRGEFVSVIGTAIVPGAAPDARWPKGYPGDYLLADERGRAFLAGDAGDAERVIVCDDFAGFVNMSLAVADAGRAYAVLGVLPHIVPLLCGVQWRAGVPLVVRTGSGDEDSDLYCKTLLAAVPASISVRRATPLGTSQTGAVR